MPPIGSHWLQISSIDYYYTAHYDKSQPKKEHHMKIFKSILKIVILVAVIIVAGYFIHTGIAAAHESKSIHRYIHSHYRRYSRNGVSLFPACARQTCRESAGSRHVACVFLYAAVRARGCRYADRDKLSGLYFPCVSRQRERAEHGTCRNV